MYNFQIETKQNSTPAFFLDFIWDIKAKIGPLLGKDTLGFFVYF